MLEPGSILGDRYRVGRVLGKGGMGVVVEATHVQLGTHVAIKVLKQETVDPAHVERFLREARAAAQLRGEHICRVHDFGTLPDGAPYMVMELLHGFDLATMLRASGPVEPAVLSRYMLEVCTAIAEAHAAGIIHRDLKPSNLYVVERPDGVRSVKVLDFGIAKSIAKQDFALTDTRNVMGSPAYMSPEQLKSSKNVDQRSDIWSIGVVMFEMISGTHPFKGETLTELAINIANDPIPPLPEPPEFVSVILRCLEKDPSKRYPNVAALAKALEPLAPKETKVADAVARQLTGSRSLPMVDGAATVPSLPSNLPELSAGRSLARAISEVAAQSERERTTLGAASGEVAAQTERHRRRVLPLAVAGVALAGALVVVGVIRLGSHDRTERAAAPSPSPSVPQPSSSAPQPSPSAAQPSSSVPPPSSLVPPPSSLVPPPSSSVPPPSSVSATESAPSPAATATHRTSKPTKRVKRPSKQGTAPVDLTKSRY